MINKIATLFVKKKPTFLEKAKSTATSYGSKAKAKGMDAFGKMQKTKLYKDASNSISELSAKYKKSYRFIILLIISTDFNTPWRYRLFGILMRQKILLIFRQT